jgi:hypothetical protein
MVNGLDCRDREWRASFFDACRRRRTSVLIQVKLV